ncbi:RNA 2',3'-cyclic phosphodiesterase [bacterium]|nr:RNA 2',3'-cyclic phosphodiesterase [bacterium]MCI0604827.1 RNA 2',3'-cyclic phosphodiesterase [bacterium]
MSKKRLFVAIGLPESIRGELEQLQKQLKPFARDAKWVNISGIHLTLKFLGYVDPAQLTEITDALAIAAKDQSVLSIQASGCGFFPNARRPNVLWVGVSAPELLPLQQNVEEAMSKLGFEKENRAFSPHLTLARFKEHRGHLLLANETENLAGKDFGGFTANSFSLYESILRPQGAQYHILQDFLLKPQINTDEHR